MTPDLTSPSHCSPPQRAAQAVGVAQGEDSSLPSWALPPTGTNPAPHNRPHRAARFQGVYFQHQFDLSVYLFAKCIVTLQSAAPYTLLFPAWNLLKLIQHTHLQ